MLILTVALFVGALLLVWNESQESGNNTIPAAGSSGPEVSASGAGATGEPVAAEDENVRTTPVEMPGEGTSEEAAAGEEIVPPEGVIEGKGVEANAGATEETPEAPVVEVVEPADEQPVEAVAAEEVPAEEAPAEGKEEPVENAAVEVAEVEESPAEPEVVVDAKEVPAAEARELAAERYGVGINPSHRLISRSKLYRFGDRDFIPVTDLPGGDALVNACILSKAPVSAYRSRLYRGFTAIRLSCAGEMKVVCEILGCPSEQSCVTSASWVKPCK